MQARIEVGGGYMSRPATLQTHSQAVLRCSPPQRSCREKCNKVLRVTVFLALTLRVSHAQSDEDLKRPYSFGFTIENEQHRQEMKDERGIIQGEYGFFTADGWYQTTIYATDEEGRFIVVGKKRHFIGPATTPAPLVTISSPRPFSMSVTPTTYRPPHSSASIFQGVPGCGSCIVPTTTQRPPAAIGGGHKQTTGPGSFNNNLSGGSPALQPSVPQTPSGFRPSTGPYGNAAGNGGFRPPSTSPQVNEPRPGSVSRPSSNDYPRPGSVSRPSSNDYPRPGSRPSTNGQQQPSRPIVVPDDNLGPNSGPNYRFKYILGFHGHEETGFKDGSKTGDYFVNTRDGTGHKITYQANEFGYQPKVTQVKLSPGATPRKDTEQQEDGLKEYEFVWFKR
ncbi:hypothetical protein B566_EDAN012273 [Ephemera danica]|nr:hypothetical protein B566_EDAN012273 [Ephemera danica]